MIAALRRHFPQQVRWTEPEGGLFLWVRLPRHVEGTGLFVAARQRGVLYSRGDLFHSDGRGGHTLRLAFAAVTPEQIETGIETLGMLTTERLGRGETLPVNATETMPIF